MTDLGWLHPGSHNIFPNHRRGTNSASFLRIALPFDNKVQETVVDEMCGEKQELAATNDVLGKNMRGRMQSRESKNDEGPLRGMLSRIWVGENGDGCLNHPKKYSGLRRAERWRGEELNTSAGRRKTKRMVKRPTGWILGACALIGETNASTEKRRNDVIPGPAVQSLLPPLHSGQHIFRDRIVLWSFSTSSLFIVAGLRLLLLINRPSGVCPVFTGLARSSKVNKPRLASTGGQQSSACPDFPYFICANHTTNYLLLAPAGPRAASGPFHKHPPRTPVFAEYRASLFTERCDVHYSDNRTTCFIGTRSQSPTLLRSGPRRETVSPRQTHALCGNGDGGGMIISPSEAETEGMGRCFRAWDGLGFCQCVVSSSANIAHLLSLEYIAEVTMTIDVFTH
ncbi:hypothetical protein H4582DRAFT_2061800 [Lactarius indigo]|nr:hypothetical protein H4582DRAFT_2061800 [Lactarius indigo]